jgi:HAMP domain-containing protein
VDQAGAHVAGDRSLDEDLELFDWALTRAEHRCPILCPEQAGRNDVVVTGPRHYLDVPRHVIAGTAISFNIVAVTARVSRSWLYRQPDIRAEIDRLRSTTPTVARLPAAQRSSTESTRQGPHTELDEIQRLKAELGQLRQQLARNYGQQRSDALLQPPDDTSATCSQHEDPRPPGRNEPRSR